MNETKRMTDEETKEFIKKYADVKIPSELQSMEKVKRDEIVRKGALGEVKADMNFRRFLFCRGTQNVLAETILLGLAHNVNKLHNKIQSNPVDAGTICIH